MAGNSVIDATPLDREWYSQTRCERCEKRRVQLTIDSKPLDRRGGSYHRFCWQCYWFAETWKLGPIVNCGPAWDVVDVRREVFRKAPTEPLS